MLGHLAQPRYRGCRKAPHGVAVEINGGPVMEKAVTERCELVLGIEGSARVTVESGRKFGGHRRLRTSQSSGKNRSEMVVSRYATPPPPVPGRDPISRAAICA